MKKLFLLFLLSPLALFGQASAKINNAQNVFASGQPRAIISCDTLPSGTWRTYPKAQITWEFSQVTNKPTTLSGYGILDGVNIVDFTWSNLSGKPSFATVATTGSYLNLSNTPIIPTNNNQLTNGSGYITASSIDALTNKSGNISQWTNNTGYLTSVPPQAWSTITGKPATLSGYGITDAYPLTGNPSAFLTSINSSQIFTALGYIPVNPNGTNTQYIAGDGTKITFPTIPPVTSIYTVTRAINSATYTISTTKAAEVRYNIKIVCSASIGSTSSGKVLFQYSTDSGSTWIDAGEVENSNTVTLALPLNSVTTQTGFIVWKVPTNALCRLVPTSSGTTTITYVRGQEEY